MQGTKKEKAALWVVLPLNHFIYISACHSVLFNIIAQMKALGIERVVSMGSRGVLPDSHGNFLMDATDYPPELVPVALEHRQAYLYLKESGLTWTFVCPPAIVKRAADNNFITLAEMAPDGTEVSSGNLALFMVEEAERISYPRQRVGISDY